MGTNFAIQSGLRHNVEKAKDGPIFIIKRDEILTLHNDSQYFEYDFDGIMMYF